METVIKSIVLCLVIFIGGGTGCAQNLPASSNQEANTNGATFGAGLSGSIRTINDETINLGTVSTVPRILIFAQETCSVCAAETKKIRNYTSQKTLNVEIYTVLVGSTREDAQDWQNFHQPTWKLAYEPTPDLFLKYCYPAQVPCVVAETPQKGIVFNKIGAFEIFEIEKETGLWF